MAVWRAPVCLEVVVCADLVMLLLFCDGLTVSGGVMCAKDYFLFRASKTGHHNLLRTEFKAQSLMMLFLLRLWAFVDQVSDTSSSQAIHHKSLRCCFHSQLD